MVERDVKVEFERLKKDLVEVAQLMDGLTKLIAALAVENGGKLTINNSTIVELSPNVVLDSQRSIDGKFIIKVRDAG